VRSAITDTAVVTGRNLHHLIRQPDLLVFSTIQPVIFVLLFVYVFGGAIGGSLPHGITSLPRRDSRGGRVRRTRSAAATTGIRRRGA
jgi:hypothetical protein